MVGSLVTAGAFVVGFFAKKDCGYWGFGVNYESVFISLKQAILTLLTEDYYESGF